MAIAKMADTDVAVELATMAQKMIAHDENFTMLRAILDRQTSTQDKLLERSMETKVLMQKLVAMEKKSDRDDARHEKLAAKVELNTARGYKIAGAGMCLSTLALILAISLNWSKLAG